MNWKDEINDIYELATLHSWCSQVNVMIEDFNKVHLRNNSITAYLVSQLKMKNLPCEYYIISIVLLNYQDYPKVEIIELAINSLYSKLNKNDIIFFKDHLFFKKFPLSSDLSEDITNRAFLSPKVAIEKAMKIDSVISKTNPIITVLYMSFILSRMDMNEENRSMVAFLLLRLDIELPKSLKERVYKYLFKYKDIIEELLQEETGESIQFQDISGIKEKISKVEIIEEIDSKSISKPDKPDKPIKSSQANQVNQANQTHQAHQAHQAHPNINSVKDQINIKNKVDNTGERNFPEINTISESNSDKISVLKKDELQPKSFSTKAGSITTPENSKINQINSNMVNHPSKNSGTKELPINNKIKYSNNNKDSDNLEKSKPEDVNPNSENKSWKIYLKENQLILKNILLGIGKSDSSSVYRVIKRTKSNNSKKKNIKNPVVKKRLAISFIIIFLLSAVLLVPVFRSNNRTEGKPFFDGSIIKNDTNIDNSLANNPESRKAEVELKSGDNHGIKITNSDQVTESSKVSLPEDFPINITIEGKIIVWKVLEGESITGLFFAFKEYKESFKNTKLEKLVNLSWEDFFNTFKDNNPKRDSYHLIFPGEVFSLPIE